MKVKSFLMIVMMSILIATTQAQDDECDTSQLDAASAILAADAGIIKLFKD